MKTWLLLVLMLSLLNTTVACGADDNLKAFPPAEPGLVRHVLQLEPLDDETAYQVELLVGRMAMLDKDNNYRFGGTIETEVVQGWGYTRYVVRKIGPIMGTLMAVDPNAPKVERFVPIGGGPYLIRYNSRLPVVVYAPEGSEVRYRIWRGGAEILPMNEG